MPDKVHVAVNQTDVSLLAQSELLYLQVKHPLVQLKEPSSTKFKNGDTELHSAIPFVWEKIHRRKQVCMHYMCICFKNIPKTRVILWDGERKGSIFIFNISPSVFLVFTLYITYNFNEIKS